MRGNIMFWLGLVGAATSGFACSADAGSGTSDAAGAAIAQPLQNGNGQSDESVRNGRHLFFKEVPGIGGNGRACTTCHVPDDNYQLTPAHVQERWDALQKARLTDPNADDPLFRSIDANDFASDFSNLKRGLVRVVLTLPKDASGQTLIYPLDDPGATTVDVFRAVPSIFNVAFTAPYQYDGRFATLEEQALGALRGHAQVTQDPAPGLLSDIAAFQKTQFSSPRVKLLADALESGQAPPSDPPLNELETSGKALFQVNCAVCHGGPRGIEPLPQLAALQDIMLSKPLPPFAADLPFPASPPLRVRLWAVRIPGAPEPAVRPSTDPGRALITGKMEDFNQFNIPSLYGIRKTGPYFRDNSAADLTQVVVHYQQLATAVRRIVPPEVPFPSRPLAIADDDIAPIVAYLNKL